MEKMNKSIPLFIVFIFIVSFSNAKSLDTIIGPDMFPNTDIFEQKMMNICDPLSEAKFISCMITLTDLVSFDHIPRVQQFRPPEEWKKLSMQEKQYSSRTFFRYFFRSQMERGSVREAFNDILQQSMERFKRKVPKKDHPMALSTAYCRRVVYVLAVEDIPVEEISVEEALKGFPPGTFAKVTVQSSCNNKIYDRLWVM